MSARVRAWLKTQRLRWRLGTCPVDDCRRPATCTHFRGNVVLRMCWEHDLHFFIDSFTDWPNEEGR